VEDTTDGPGAAAGHAGGVHGQGLRYQRPHVCVWMSHGVDGQRCVLCDTVRAAEGTP